MIFQGCVLTEVHKNSGQGWLKTLLPWPGGSVSYRVILC